MPVLLENKIGITSASILLGSTFIPITALALLEGQSRYNGSIRVSTAILTSSFSVGQMIGPYFGGVIIDLFNSYSIALTIAHGMVRLALDNPDLIAFDIKTAAFLFKLSNLFNAEVTFLPLISFKTNLIFFGDCLIYLTFTIVSIF